MMTTVEYRMEATEFIAGARLCRKSVPWLNQSRRFVIPGLCILVAAVIISYFALHNERLSEFGSTGVLCILIMGLLFLLPYFEDRTAVSRFKKQDLGRLFGVAFDEEGITSIDPGKSEGRFLWPAILKMVEGENVVLLFYSKTCCLIFPRRIFPDEEWTRMRSYITPKAGTN